jgi:hypothetical protein
MHSTFYVKSVRLRSFYVDSLHSFVCTELGEVLGLCVKKGD